MDTIQDKLMQQFQNMDNAYEAATSVINGFVIGHGCLKELLKQYIEEDTGGK